jgi:acyl-CoA dehydrogenase
LTAELLDGLVAPSEAAGAVAQAAWQVGVEAAGPAADAVDRDSRFPSEALAGMRERSLLSALVPAELGGGGATLAEVSAAVRAIAFHCASSALVLAMHSIEVSNLVRHGTSEPLRELLREIAGEQLLLANANSEVGIGGDVGHSICALETLEDGALRLDKQALAISYGEHADAIVATARRSPDAAATDQVYVVCRRPTVTLERTSTWDSIGLRGTCSPGFRLLVDVDPALIYPVPFAVVGAAGGVQAQAILLSSTWVGIAEAAASKAHAFVRAAARRAPDVTPPGALRVAELGMELNAARALLAANASRFVALDRRGEIESPGFIVALRGLKVTASRIAVNVARAALEVCGIAGYKRDTPMTLDRHVRDAHGGLVMISNERYLQTNAQLLLARKQL